MDDGIGRAWFSKDGAGTLVLAGSNTFTGPTAFNAGAVVVTSQNALGTAAGATTLDGGHRWISEISFIPHLKRL